MTYNFADQEGTNKQITQIRKCWRSNQPMNPIPRIIFVPKHAKVQGHEEEQNRQIQHAPMQSAFSQLAIPWNPTIYRVLKTMQEKSRQSSKASGSNESVFQQSGQLPVVTITCKSPIEKCHQTMGGQPTTKHGVRPFMPQK